MKYTKEQAVSIAIKYGKEYKKKLADTKVLIMLNDPPKMVYCSTARV